MNQPVENPIDITGIMVQPKVGWQKRADELCKPEHFLVSITYHPPYNTPGLTDNEYDRLNRKLILVRRAAKLMCAGMLKGVLKYSTDEYSVEQWMAHVVGEGADQMNYQMLLLDAFEKMPRGETNDF